MSIRWKGDLPINLRKFDGYVERRTLVAAEAFAPRAERHMKERAPWTDRTGAARNGLTARAEPRPHGAAVVLAHGVDYGIWLEIAHSGHYAIVIPSVVDLAPDFMALAARIIFVDRTISEV